MVRSMELNFAKGRVDFTIIISSFTKLYDMTRGCVEYFM